jgi:hypothetical protein
MAKIYESPDGGRTVYERDIGCTTSRTVAKEDTSLISQLREDQLWGDIRRRARTHPGLQAELERVIMFYNLIKHDNR